MYDYIIVGAGSAGCVLANRLSADPAVRVLLIEAGGSDWHPFIHMPAGLAKLVKNPSINWSYETEAEPQLDGRRLYWPRGRVLGGSSSINAMCYIRGHARDYDEWAEAGNPGWSYAEMLPWFKRAEDQQRGASAHHGVGGPLAVQDLRHTNPLSSVFLQATEQAGFARTDDFNTGAPEGFGFYQVTQRDGRRCSAATGYLLPARGRSNLDVLTHALAERVEFKGDQAVALHIRQGRHQRRIEVSGEIILSGGAINSPQLLLLSGIGPEAQLRELGIGVRVPLPGVGENLQDHLDLCLLQRCRERITYDRQSDLLIGLQYLFTRSGVGSSNVAEAGGFVRSERAPDERSDLQFHFVPALLDDHGRNRLPGDGYTVHVCGLRPRSRGRITLRSSDPAQAPRIQANYLAEEEDLEVMLSGFRISREIFRQAPFAHFDAGELVPGKAVDDRAGIIEFLRRKAETIYHPVGTCRMGRDGSAVVDAELRVHGTRGLRVVDASIMPTLIGGNTNAPTIAIAEKIAQRMTGR